MNDTHNRHLSPDQIWRVACGGLAESNASSHLGMCLDCSAEVAELRKWLGQTAALKASFPEAATPQCPDLQTLALLISGSLPDDKAASLTEHISICGHCGPLVRDSLNMASKPAPSQRSWYRMAAAALLVCGLVGFLWFRHAQQSSVESLLAQSFTAVRPFEMRLPDAGYSPVTQTRAAGESSLSERSAAFAQAEAQIAKQIASKPEPSSHMLLLLAQAQMLDNRFDAAIDSLQKAAQLSPDDPQILATLGSAYALRGQSEARPLDLAKAIENLRRAAEIAPSDPIANFNLALLEEHMSLVDQAIEQWEKYLRVDPNSGWSAEAKHHLSDLRKLKGLKSTLEPALNPSSFLSLQTPVEPEAYLDEFWTQWLPESISNPAAKAAAFKLAKAFPDPMLIDALQESAGQSAALKTLADAIGRNQQSLHGEAAPLVVAAQTAFSRASQPALVLRTQFENLYTLQRLEQSSQCVANGVRLLTQLERTRYLWLRDQTRITLGACLFQAGNFTEAARFLADGADDAHRHGFSILQMRANGIRGELDKDTGGPATVFATSPALLRIYWRSASPPVRAHQAYYDLAESADLLGLSAAAEMFGEAAISAASQTPNQNNYFLTRMRVADYAANAGDFNRAFSLLRQSEEMATHLSLGEYKAYALVEKARLLLRAGRYVDAIRESDRLNSESLPTTFQLNRLAVLTQAQARLGHNEEARRAFASAFQLQRDRIAAVPSFSKRRAAMSDQRDLFALMSQLETTDLHPDRGFSIWDWFQDGGSTSDLSIGLKFRIPPGMAVISFCSQADSLTVWVVDSAGLACSSFTINRQELKNSSQRFAALCARPDSSRKELQKQGRALYNKLFGWSDAKLQNAPEWIILPDDATASIPFSALTTANGRYLVQDHALLFPRSLRSFESQPTAHFEWRRGQEVSATAPSSLAVAGLHLSFLSDAVVESSSVSSLFANHLVLSGQTSASQLRNALASAEIFHFAGHGWSNGGNGALLLQEDVFSAASIADLHLRHSHLVVLSACLTGSGESEGPLNPDGLVHAFGDAGSERILAAKWNVDSRVNGGLISGFFQRLVSQSPPYEALASAQRAVLAEPQSAHPYYWAAYQLFGGV